MDKDHGTRYPECGTVYRSIENAKSPRRRVTRVDRHHVYYTWEGDPSYLEHRESRAFFRFYMVPVEDK